MPNGSDLTLCHELACTRQGRAPDWVQLIPPGVSIQGRDGRAWRLPDPGAVIKAFNLAGIDLAIDYEHQVDDPKRRSGNGPAPAGGWIKALRFDAAQGLLGRVEWTATARQLIEGREYRFLSPVFLHDRTGTITRLVGASLVHRPNLQLKALAHEEITTMTDNPLSRIATTLGLEHAADEATILTAINSVQAETGATPDPTRFVPIEAVRELMLERAQTKATASEEVAESRVQTAMNAGYLTPAMRDWAVSLCRADPASFDSFLSSATPAYAHLFDRSNRPTLNAETRNCASSTEEADVFAQLGLDPSDGV